MKILYIPLVGLEEEIINNDFTQSVLADFAIFSYNEKETKPGFYCGLLHVSHGIMNRLVRTQAC